VINTLQIPTNKIQLKAYADRVVDELVEGKATELFVTLKYAEKLIADLLKREEVRTRIMNEVQNLEKEFEFMGCTIKKSETGTRYDFTVCQDAEWNTLSQQEKEVSIMRKAREEILKGRVGRKPEVRSNFDTGEVTMNDQEIPPVKTSESFITVTIK
jgi:hypothetical protein